jgi:hypothetical protein
VTICAKDAQDFGDNAVAGYSCLGAVAGLDHNLAVNSLTLGDGPVPDAERNRSVQRGGINAAGVGKLKYSSPIQTPAHRPRLANGPPPQF